MKKEFFISHRVTAKCRENGCDWASEGELMIVDGQPVSSLLSEVDLDLHSSIVAHHRGTRIDYLFGHEYYVIDTDDNRQIRLRCHDFYAEFTSNFYDKNADNYD